MYDLAGAVTEFDQLLDKVKVQRGSRLAVRVAVRHIQGMLAGKKLSYVAMNSVDYMCLCYRGKGKMEYAKRIMGLEIKIIEQLPDGMVVVG